MNEHDYHSLIASLNNAVAILARNRTPEPASVAAYDTLKQARAMIENTLRRTAPAPLAREFDLAA